MAGAVVEGAGVSKGGRVFTALLFVAIDVADCLFNRKKRTNNNQCLSWKWKSRTEVTNWMKDDESPCFFASVGCIPISK